MKKGEIRTPEINVNTQIEKLIENQQILQEYREHLGASLIGAPCTRQTWFNFHWFKPIFITPRLQRLFNRGHMEELVIIEDLIKQGIKVEGINIDSSILNRFKTLFNVDLPNHTQNNIRFCGGHCGGSTDGILFLLPGIEKKKGILECKTSNTKGFEEVKKFGVEIAKKQHFVQTQIYMNKFKAKYTLYIMVCKETDERHYEIIKYNKKLAFEYIKKAEMIATAERAPQRVSEDKNYYLCNWCDYKRICHENETPMKNCRTCHYQGMRNEGVWICETTQKELKYKKQLKGCSDYRLMSF